MNFAVGIERLRFGYVDRTSEFVLRYEGEESDRSVFPGKQLYTCPEIRSQMSFALLSIDLLCRNLKLIWNLTF